MMRSHARYLTLIALTMLATVAFACGGDDDDSDDTPPADVDARAVMAAAADTLAALDSFHFRLTHENGSTPIVFDLGLQTADGNIAAPDKLQADIEAERGAIRIEVEVISIGEDIWLTDPFGSGTWQRIEEGIAIRDIFAPDEGIPELLRGAVDARVTGSERIDGVPTYRIEAEVDAADIESLAPVAEPGVIVPVTVWIGQDDSLLRRARLEGPINNEEGDDIRRQIELSGFDEPVTIEPPETG